MSTQIHHHYCYIIHGTSVECLKDEAFSAKMGLPQSLFDILDGFLVGKGIPQSIGGKDQELGIVFIKVKGQDVGVSDHKLVILERVVSDGTGSGQDSCHTPDAVESDKTSGFLDAFALLGMVGFVVVGKRDGFAGSVAHNATRISDVCNDHIRLGYQGYKSC